MTIKDFNLLQIEVYENDNIIYTGMSEDVPDDLKERKIQIQGIDGKKVKIKLI